MILFNLIKSADTQKEDIETFQSDFSSKIRKISPETFFDDVLGHAKLLRLLIFLDTQPKKDYKKKLKEVEKKTIIEELETVYQQFTQIIVNQERQLRILPTQLKLGIIYLNQTIQKLNHIIKNIQMRLIQFKKTNTS